MKGTLLDRAYDYTNKLKVATFDGYDTEKVRDSIVKDLISILPKKRESMSSEIYKLAQSLKEEDCSKYTPEAIKVYAYNKLVTIINFEVLYRF